MTAQLTQPPPTSAPTSAPDGGPILTPGNVAPIAAVRRDPGNAWRAEPPELKAAHAAERGAPLPDDADEELIDRRLERLIGDDDLVPSRWLRAGQRLADAVALIRQPGCATGFLVSDWLLLTNNHVLDAPPTAESADVLFRYEEDEDGCMNPVRVQLDPQRCFVTSPWDELDFTLVAVRPMPDGTAPGLTFGRVPLGAGSGKVLAGQPLNIVQHPDGQSRRVAFRNNRLLSLDDERRLVYETDTRPGSSGSPVLNDRWQLVALHHRSEQARVDVNGGPLSDRTPEHLRTWVANSGIRVSCLVAHLRALPLEPGVRELVDAAIV
jgi:endonuclease G